MFIFFWSITVHQTKEIQHLAFSISLVVCAHRAASPANFDCYCSVDEHFMPTSLSDHYHISTASQLQCLALVPLRQLKTVHWLFIYRLLCCHQILFPPVKNTKRSSMRESGTSLVLLAHHCHTACYWRLHICFTIPPLTL